MKDNYPDEHYFLEKLYRELFFQQEPRKNRLAEYIRTRLLELLWTITRLMGLGFLHDGRWRSERRLRQALAERPSLPTAVQDRSHSPRILIDVTSTHFSGKNTGIQRVVKEVAFAAAEMGLALPVFQYNAKLHPYFKNASATETIEPESGDVFLMIDAPSGMLATYSAIIDQVKKQNGQAVACVYDLLPKTIPWAFSPEQREHYDNWFSAVVCNCDAVVCISENVANELQAHLAALPEPRQMPIGWFHLGGDFRCDLTQSVSRDVAAITQVNSPFFLGVGTLEPRKGYDIALDAMEELWRSDIDARFVVVGRYGWASNALQQRILEHEQYGKRLHWLANANDADLICLYRNARALVYPSLAEGFGLPIMEAANHGLPVIASDIPIFRELAAEHISYFKKLDSSALATQLRAAVSTEKQAPKIEVATWKQSTHTLLDMIRTQSYQLNAGSRRR
ncbi:MAG: glycosyltransferase family 1 protein [Methylocystis sp.]|uniref:glycosyltransferase family 4 protein n=1 Tax=Methylocystis sp. TaxID=1911079 RepID=UPI0039297D55